MLFVSKTETQLLENLPDTSLHNVRSQAQASQQQTSSCSTSSSSSSSSDFFSAPDPCLLKLNKEEFNLHKEFLRLGTALMAENPDLFFQAVKLLSDKHKLKVATPATSLSDIVPFSRGVRHKKLTGAAAAAAAAGVGSVGSRGSLESESVEAPRAPTRKYIIPQEFASKEYYKCMVCKEQRASNSFGVDHVHEGSGKPNIRWHCPICDNFFAVTHRGYHLKNKHMIFPQSEQVDPAVKAHPEGLKRARDETSSSSSSSNGEEEEECESAVCSLPGKVWVCECPTVSPESAVSNSPVSMVSATTPFCPSVAAEEENFVPTDTTALPYFPSQEEESGSFQNPFTFFTEGEEITPFPSCFNNGADDDVDCCREGPLSM